MTSSRILYGSLIG